MIHIVGGIELLPLLSNRMLMTSQITIVGQAYPGKHIRNNARYLVTKKVKQFTLGYFSMLDNFFCHPSLFTICTRTFSKLVEGS
jgi:hypothetical protein